jgi:hypothetical protein
VTVGSIGVNERDGGTLYNTQLLFDADGTLIRSMAEPPAGVRSLRHGRPDAPIARPLKFLTPQIVGRLVG